MQIGHSSWRTLASAAATLAFCSTTAVPLVARADDEEGAAAAVAVAAPESVPASAPASTPGEAFPPEIEGARPEVRAAYVGGRRAAAFGDHAAAAAYFSDGWKASRLPLFLRLSSEEWEALGEWRKARILLQRYVDLAHPADEAALRARAVALAEAEAEERSDHAGPGALGAALDRLGPAPTTGISFFIGGAQLLGLSVGLARLALNACGYGYGFGDGGTCKAVIGGSVGAAAVGAGLLALGGTSYAKFRKWRARRAELLAAPTRGGLMASVALPF